MNDAERFDLNHRMLFLLYPEDKLQIPYSAIKFEFAGEKISSTNQQEEHSSLAMTPPFVAKK